MSFIPRVTCRRCGRQYSGLRGRCPYCGTRRVKQSDRVPATSASTDPGSAAGERAASNSRWQLIFGGILLLAVILAALHLDIKTLSCSVESPHGKIAASWKKEGETVTFTAEIPFGTTARLCLPDEVCADENGKLLESGRHEFCWKLKKAAK